MEPVVWDRQSGISKSEIWILTLADCYDLILLKSASCDRDFAACSNDAAEEGAYQKLAADLR